MVEKEKRIEFLNKSQNVGIIENSKNTPSPRSLHTLVYLNKNLYLFGGYDGTKRTNDFYKYDLIMKSWSKVVTQDIPPSTRERHVAVVHDNSMFIFGGYDGINRLNDFYEFNSENNTWQEVIYSGSGLPPTPRHSMCAIVYDGNMYVFAGYDGFCRSELHRFNFETNTWREITKRPNMQWPRERYRTSAALYKNGMYIYGGHDGTKQLEDFWCFDLKKQIWEEIKIKQNLPTTRDSHTTFVYKDCLYIQGGTVNLQSKADFFELNFNTNQWSIVKEFCSSEDVMQTNNNVTSNSTNSNTNSNNPFLSITTTHLNNPNQVNFSSTSNISNSVFCHSGAFVPFQETFYIFGGYNGLTRHNIFKFFSLKEDENSLLNSKKQQSQILDSYVNNPKFSDITLIMENEEKIHGHKILLARIPYFDNLFNSGMKESFEKEISLNFINSKIMTIIMKYIYTGRLNFEIEETIPLYEACNYLGLEDLNLYCEEKIISISNSENACTILLKADEFNSTLMKEKIIKYIIDNFLEVVNSSSFSSLLDHKELALEVIRGYSNSQIGNKSKITFLQSNNSMIN